MKRRLSMPMLFVLSLLTVATLSFQNCSPSFETTEQSPEELALFSESNGTAVPTPTPSPTPVPTPTPTPVPVPAQATASGFTKLVFADEFDKLSLSPSGGGKFNWFNGLPGLPGHANPSAMFQVNESALTVAGLPGDYALLSSFNKKEGSAKSAVFNKGYIEARLKMNNPADNYAAFSLRSSEHAEGKDKLPAPLNDQWCEMDVFEAWNASHFAGNLTVWQNSAQPTEFFTNVGVNNYQTLPNNFDLTEFHKWGLLWEENKVTWYLDDQVVMTSVAPFACNTQNMYLVLSSGSHSGSGAADVIVDYVHVFQTPPPAPTPTPSPTPAK